MAITSLLFVFTFFCILIENQTQAADKTCTTVENLQGQCVLLEQCEPLLKLKRKRPYTMKEESYLKKALCGFENEIYAKVCCPAQLPLDTKTRSMFGKVEFDGPITSPLLPNATICGPINDNRIRGGESTILGDYPWMALLEYDTPTGKKFSCSGSLINNRYVLTAAHCVVGKQLPREWILDRVVLGEYNLTSPTECIKTETGPICFEALKVKVEEKIVHEKYDPESVSQYHDIALLRLSKGVVFTDVIKPICIPTTEDLLDRVYAGITMKVAGWGSTENQTQSETLLQLMVTVKSNSECAAVYKRRLNIGVGQLCAGGELGKDSCKGDSGGPLMVVDVVSTNINYYVAGIVSFGPDNCGLENWPGVYTKLSPYVSWIVNNLKP